MSQENSKPLYRIGASKDIHILGLNRKLMLAGVHVPYSLGEIAHSDGDVVYHALAESILGALALGDLGKHFPDNDPSTENMDSALIVRHVVHLMHEAGYNVNNVDIFIALEAPKLKDYIDKMRDNVAYELDIPLDCVSIKAGTNEGVGEVGRNTAVEASSTVLLRRIS
ncbi:MAG: 2-C-methyl-D-erythritol 2,4-cyclodiphosphate synthase [Bacilli bacterium]|nr:2-C-methyl-D-erythritol 2,4-cyclodiphosphate synthase [Bacilli bacterium]